MKIRVRAGEEHPQAKFTNDEAEQLRHRFEEEATTSIRALAREKGVSPQTMADVINGKRYR